MITVVEFYSPKYVLFMCYDPKKWLLSSKVWLWDSIKCIFAVLKKTTGTVLLKIWNQTLDDGPQCKVKKQHIKKKSGMHL